MLQITLFKIKLPNFLYALHKSSRDIVTWLLSFSQIEELGSEGRVEEAQGMMKLVEQLKEERELLSSTPSVSQFTLG